MAQSMFDMVKRRAFDLHCRPLNRVRVEHGFASLGHDLRLAYTDADYTLYADAPAMFPVERLPSRHRFLGPILWSPPVPAPDWWHDLPTDKPIVYLTLGSSGSPRLMHMVIDALADQPVTVIASTAGAPVPHALAQNLRVADYLPGTEAAARSSLVICNGGSPTSQQALACGVPVLGIVSNMDQFMNMAAVARSGAGAMVRADRISARHIRETVVQMISDSDWRRRAKSLARSLGELDSGQTFRDFVGEIFADAMARTSRGQEEARSYPASTF
jgi:UDP:flavonoid glycosyltransferase YjiC (YdhE family)